MTREILTSTLSTIAAELNDIKTETAMLHPKLTGLSRKKKSEFLNKHPERRSEFETFPDGPIPPHYRYSKQQSEHLASLRQRLDRVGQALAVDKAAWESERATYESIVTILGGTRPVTPSTSPQAREPETDRRAFQPTTLFSEAGQAILDARLAALDPNDEDGRRYEERLATSFAVFLELIGDKPLSYYLPIHMQDYATALAKLPTNWKKKPLFKGMTLTQAIEKNASLPLEQRVACLSETTVSSYLSEIKNIWSRVAAGVPGLRDMSAYRITMPKDVEEAIEREPLTVSSLNVWIRDAASSKRRSKPHQSWLPIAGLLTGMRLAELIYLQRSDFVEIEGNEVIDLTQPLLISGKTVDRPVKTKTSKRYVAIHPLLSDLGFVEYAKTVKTQDGFVFSRFHQAEDPADAAQKQMANWMKDLGIHVTQKQVFHSLRHNAKDWIRDSVGPRLADKQCGHAFQGVSANYGAKLLKPKEVKRIMRIRPPEGLDFSAFLSS
ncbi:hypothetical protein J5J10_04840 [Ciceribacter sp. L1K23]|uniref:hypothetical protein n=1 Tax=Ciceribacter sp. L1K23 TaxID=2820276 RepID=UPI001B828595|nr:hypothetical protein [Ciceribacter sp. L1K23]MBR0555001.1 hypothetical protein [Ciceribacter sp. L1K23]